MTPEGKVKADVKKLLKAHGCVSASEVGKSQGGDGWYFMPSQNGMGVKSIPDFIGCHKGRFFCIETKAPKKAPTQLQWMQMGLISSAGGECFVVSGDTGLDTLEEWLK